MASGAVLFLYDRYGQRPRFLGSMRPAFARRWGIGTVLQAFRLSFGEAPVDIASAIHEYGFPRTARVSLSLGL